MGDGGWRGDDIRRAGHAAVALGVEALAHDREVGAAGGERREQAVDVAPHAAAVGGHCGRVDEHARVTAAGQGALLVAVGQDGARARSSACHPTPRQRAARPAGAEQLRCTRRAPTAPPDAGTPIRESRPDC